MIRIFTSFVLALCICSTALAQVRDAKLDKAAKNGKEVPTRINVGSVVTAQAVLIPQIDARRIFGKEIADNYAVIEVNVGNKSSDAALIIHGIFIDYTRWALSGIPNQPPSMVDGILRESDKPFQASTNANQVASEEYRVVRGQLLDAQMWSKRNWTMRLLTLAGSLAGAYAFSIKEDGIIRGLNAFSGVVVPGIREAWPDGTIEQLNRVSDFGFQTNKVIPQQGGEVIVCFFPIDRFLTPGFKKLFLKSPALFFSPLQMLVDKSLKKEAEDILKGIDSNLTIEQLRGALPCYLRVAQELRFGSAASNSSFGGLVIQNADAACHQEFGLEKVEEEITKDGKKEVKKGLRVMAGKENNFRKFLALDFISQMSLNTVSVTIDGAMTVDITTIAGKPEAVAFDKLSNCESDELQCFWADIGAGDGVRSGTITGAYLTGGSVTIAEAEELGIKEVKTISEGSSDQRLNFSFKLTKPVPQDTRLHFIITKPKGGSASPTETIDSLPREYRVGFSPKMHAITSVEQNENKLTVNGSDFFDLPLVVTLHPPDKDAADVTVDKSKVKIKSPSQFEVTIPAEAETPGCWTLTAKVGELLGQRPANNTFIILPSLDSATLDGDQIIVEGKGFDATDCSGEPPSFKLLHGKKSFDLKADGIPTGTKVTFKLPPAAKGVDATWKLQIQFGDKIISELLTVATK